MSKKSREKESGGRMPRKGGNESSSEKKLRVAVYANLGRALAIRGFCADAKRPLQIGVSGGNELAVKTLNAPCYDQESGKIVAMNK